VSQHVPPSQPLQAFANSELIPLRLPLGSPRYCHLPRADRAEAQEARNGPFRDFGVFSGVRELTSAPGVPRVPRTWTILRRSVRAGLAWGPRLFT
jgi:hypothetical protein